MDFESLIELLEDVERRREEKAIMFKERENWAAARPEDKRLLLEAYFWKIAMDYDEDTRE